MKRNISALEFDPATGRIQRAFFGAMSDQMEAYATGALLRFDPPREVDMVRSYVDLTNGEVVPRPTILPLPLNTGNDLLLAGLPDGSVVTLWNEDNESLSVTTPASPITLTDAGTYRIRVDPPWPFLPPAEQEVTLT